jgi:hypothetical protein
MLFDYHVHSKFSVSDSFSEVDDIIEAAQKAGLGALAISDHNEVEGSMQAVESAPKGLIVIPSTEVSSSDGHIVGLGVSKRIGEYMSAEDTIAEIHKMGGIAIAAHPYDSFRSGVGDLSWKLDFDAVEINGHCLYGNSKAKKMAEKHSKPLVGGSDAHIVEDIGSIATELDGSGQKEIFDNIRLGECKPSYQRNRASMKMSILADKVVRRYRMLLNK